MLASMAVGRAARLLSALLEGEFILMIKLLREHNQDWVVEDKFDPVRAERRKG